VNCRLLLAQITAVSKSAAPGKIVGELRRLYIYALPATRKSLGTPREGAKMQPYGILPTQTKDLLRLLWQ
jgi:hypothetical protein